MDGISADVLNQMFAVFVSDFSGYAATVHFAAGTTEEQRNLFAGLIRVPVGDPDQFEKVWTENVAILSGAY